MRRAFITAAALTFTVALTVHTPPAQAARCSDFAYQEDAQAFFTSGRGGNLDRDRDGVACEDLPRRGSSAPYRAPAPAPAAPSRPSSTNASNPYCVNMPRVDPWQLQQPVLMGNARSSYYYNGVILAGETQYVESFLECYGLTVKYEPNYSSARRIWAACTDVTGGGTSQTVCVAVNSQGEAADNRVFSGEYADRVAGTVFNLN